MAWGTRRLSSAVSRFGFVMSLVDSRRYSSMLGNLTSVWAKREMIIGEEMGEDEERSREEV
jgi:hypothetical protein